MNQIHQQNNENYNTSPPRATFSCHQLKVKSVRFEDPYDRINIMDNTHDDTHLIDARE